MFFVRLRWQSPHEEIELQRECANSCMSMRSANASRRLELLSSRIEVIRDGDLARSVLVAFHLVEVEIRERVLFVRVNLRRVLHVLLWRRQPAQQRRHCRHLS
eukprot:NODE_5320_length_592_cov_456.830540.p2 GENE.NODE_5320_length_592_cov_456.830540~~NODE_5320_length_592_cov_456.830540.p2  ORF type:complete len:118 (+),score=57.58 NODE_5320_length_592_cov_456.830540:47-355(+)